MLDTVELVKKVKKLEIKIKGKSQDVIAGAYKSAFKGRGMMFSEARQYQYGDDVRSIDWNISARTGDTQVKLFEEERELTIMLLIDMSASLRYGITKSKRELICEMAGVIAFNAIKTKDKVGLVLLTDKVERYIPPVKGKRGVLRIIREILNFESENSNTDLKQGLKFFNNVHRKRTIVFLFSDFITSKFDEELKVLAKRHDIIPIKIADAAEQTLPNLGLITIKDSESGAMIILDTADLEATKFYQNRLSNFNDSFTNSFNKNAKGMLSIDAKDDYIKEFLKYFKK